MDFTPEFLIRQMQQQAVVPLFTHDDELETLEIVTMSYECGVRAFEFTNRRAKSFQVFKHLVNNRNKFPGLALGIGTITDPDTTERYIDVGADFIISPILNVAMASVCHKYNKLWIAGCATPTEIVTARDHGSQLIKLFPGSVLGPGFVRAMSQVVPELKLMITGGVDGTRENLSAWFSAGATCVGMGSQLFPKEALSSKNWPLLNETLATILRTAQEVRNDPK